MNPMREIVVEKVVVHMGVGESGEKLVKAEDILKAITGQKPVRSVAKHTVPAWGVRKGAPIGCKVTLRGKIAVNFLETSLGIINKRMSEDLLDRRGNFSFGIEEHTDYPGMSYDPQIGIYGMDINVILARKGIRIMRRFTERRSIPQKQVLNKEDVKQYLKSTYGVEVQ